MTTHRRRRSRTVQLQLPLRSPPAAAAAGRRPQPDWRLDEQTRRLGRRGIAAARAVLGDGGTGEKDADADRGRSGRAA